MIFNKEEIKRLWSLGKSLRVGYKDFLVHKMSYGQFFLEPEDYKGKETEGFSKDVIWLNEDETNKNILIGVKEK